MKYIFYSTCVYYDTKFLRKARKAHGTPNAIPFLYSLSVEFPFNNILEQPNSRIFNIYVINHMNCFTKREKSLLDVKV